MLDCTAIFGGGMRDLGYMEIEPSLWLTQEIMTHRSAVATRANGLFRAASPCSTFQITLYVWSDFSLGNGIRFNQIEATLGPRQYTIRQPSGRYDG